MSLSIADYLYRQPYIDVQVELTLGSEWPKHVFVTVCLRKWDVAITPAYAADCTKYGDLLKCSPIDLDF